MRSAAPEQPTKDPLGALLAHVIQLSDTAADSKKVFAQAIVKYALSMTRLTSKGCARN